MGYKIFTHEIHSSYAARIDNFRSYDAISKDIIQRWTYPLVPDVKFFGDSSTKLERLGMYRASGNYQRTYDIYIVCVWGGVEILLYFVLYYEGYIT